MALRLNHIDEHVSELRARAVDLPDGMFSPRQREMLQCAIDVLGKHGISCDLVVNGVRVPTLYAVCLATTLNKLVFSMAPGSTAHRSFSRNVTTFQRRGYGQQSIAQAMLDDILSTMETKGFFATPEPVHGSVSAPAPAEAGHGIQELEKRIIEKLDATLKAQPQATETAPHNLDTCIHQLEKLILEKFDAVMKLQGGAPRQEASLDLALELEAANTRVRELEAHIEQAQREFEQRWDQLLGKYSAARDKLKELQKTKRAGSPTANSLNLCNDRVQSQSPTNAPMCAGTTLMALPVTIHSASQSPATAEQIDCDFSEWVV